MAEMYKVVVRGFDIKLNQILEGKVYDYRLHKYHNPVKAKGDSICIKAIKGQLKGVHITKPCIIHYHFYVKDVWDADGNISAFWKCYLDALQKAGVIENDSYKFVGYPRLDSYQIDKNDPRVVTLIEVLEDK